MTTMTMDTQPLAILSSTIFLLLNGCILNAMHTPKITQCYLAWSSSNKLEKIVNISVNGAYGTDVFSVNVSKGYMHFKNCKYLGELTFVFVRKSKSQFRNLQYYSNYYFYGNRAIVRTVRSIIVQGVHYDEFPLTLLIWRKGWSSFHYHMVEYISHTIWHWPNTTISACKHQQFIVYYKGSYDERGGYVVKHNARDTENAAYIGTLKSVRFRTSKYLPAECPHNATVYLHTYLNMPTNKYVVYSPVNVSPEFVDFMNADMSTRRVICRYGSRERLCNHVEYSVLIKQRLRYHERSDHTLIVDVRGKMTSFIHRVVVSGNETLFTVDHEFTDHIDDVYLTNTKSLGILQKTELQIGNTQTETIFDCPRPPAGNVSWKCTRRLCRGLLGHSNSQNCPKVYYSVIITYGNDTKNAHEMDITATIEGTKRKASFTLYTGPSQIVRQIGGEFLLDDVGEISSLQLTSNRKSKPTIRYDADESVVIYKGADKYRFRLSNIEDDVLPRTDTFNMWRKICVTRPTDDKGRRCDRVQVVVSLRRPMSPQGYDKTTQRLTNCPFKVDFENTQLKSIQNFVRYGKTWACFAIAEQLDVGIINSVSLVKLTTPSPTSYEYDDLTIDDITIDDGRRVQIFVVGPKTNTSRDLTSTLTEVWCPVGYGGKRCDEACEPLTFGPGCKHCHCEGGHQCTTTGECQYGYRCTPRFMSSYCDWTCPEGFYGDDCGSIDSDHAPCLNVSHICPKRCVKHTRSDECKCATEYGMTGCRKLCHCLGGVECDLSSGRCPKDKCAERYYTSDCQGYCPIGRYVITNENGIQNCTGECHCADPDVCHWMNGTCLNGSCMAGWDNAPKCDEACNYGHCGTRPCHCKTGECDKVSGTCGADGCADRYFLDDCQGHCPPGKFVINNICSGICHCRDGVNCEMMGGTCADLDCTKTERNCTDTICTKIGENCTVENCTNMGDTCTNTNCTQIGGNCTNANCTKIKDTCMVTNCTKVKTTCTVTKCTKMERDCTNQLCTSRYYGANCQNTCGSQRYLVGDECDGVCYCAVEDACSVLDGTCGSAGCVDGRRGGRCENDCRGKFGPSCSSTCHCLEGVECDVDTGACATCDVRYTGKDCQTTCYPGRYDPANGCDKECHCEMQAECYVTNGTCRRGGCAPGWHKDRCQTKCNPGNFGKNCRFSCYCRNQTEACDISTGACVSGCAIGRTGVGCQKLKSKNNIGLIAGLVSAIVVIIVVVVVAVIIFSRNHRPKSVYGHNLPPVSYSPNQSRLGDTPSSFIQKDTTDAAESSDTRSMVQLLQRDVTTTLTDGTSTSRHSALSERNALQYTTSGRRLSKTSQYKDSRTHLHSTHSGGSSSGFATPVGGGGSGFATPVGGGGSGFATPVGGGGSGFATPVGGGGSSFVTPVASQSPVSVDEHQTIVGRGFRQVVEGITILSPWSWYNAREIDPRQNVDVTQSNHERTGDETSGTTTTL